MQRLLRIEHAGMDTFVRVRAMWFCIGQFFVKRGEGARGERVSILVFLLDIDSFIYLFIFFNENVLIRKMFVSIYLVVNQLRWLVLLDSFLLCRCNYVNFTRVTWVCGNKKIVIDWLIDWDGIFFFLFLFAFIS